MPCFTTPSPKNGRVVPGQYIVAYRTDSLTNARFTAGRLISLSERLLSEYGIPPAAIKSSFAGVQKGFVCTLSAQQAKDLGNDPNVAFVEPDRVISAASCIVGLDSATLGWGPRRIGYANGIGKTVWIVDSGVDTDHPDIQVDRLRSRSFVEGQTSVEDRNGHGTHVAGVIGAKNNRIGTLGVASGATVVALRVLDELGDGKISAVVRALGYISQHARRGEVVNMSLVGDTISNILDREVSGIANRGIMFAIAAGNGARDAALVSPARVNHPNVFTVSAMDDKDAWAGFSNFGTDVIDAAAPGVGILSTGLNGRYAYLSGTSVATPHVAGLLLLDGRHLGRDGTVKNDPDGLPDPIARKR
ncbi:MAG: S8 family serine peptidase [Cytophagales bacterium]|nr:S8 family serine peptidase [Cytophagales bacterium]